MFTLAEIQFLEKLVKSVDKNTLILLGYKQHEIEWTQRVLPSLREKLYEYSQQEIEDFKGL